MTKRNKPSSRSINSTQQPQDPFRGKKKFNPPELVEYGKVRKLTQKKGGLLEDPGLNKPSTKL